MAAINPHSRRATASAREARVRRGCTVPEQSVPRLRRATRSATNFLWTTFTRFNPASDLTSAKVELVHNHPSFTPPLVIDARMKPWYPLELFCDEDTDKLVTRRWSEYFPSRKVAMGDSARGHLD